MKKKNENKDEEFLYLLKKESAALSNKLCQYLKQHWELRSEEGTTAGLAACTSMIATFHILYSLQFSANEKLNDEEKEVFNVLFSNMLDCILKKTK